MNVSETRMGRTRYTEFRTLPTKSAPIIYHRSKSMNQRNTAIISLHKVQNMSLQGNFTFPVSDYPPYINYWNIVLYSQHTE